MSSVQDPEIVTVKLPPLVGVAVESVHVPVQAPPGLMVQTLSADTAPASAMAMKMLAFDMLDFVMAQIRGLGGSAFSTSKEFCLATSFVYRVPTRIHMYGVGAVRFEMIGRVPAAFRVCIGGALVLCNMILSTRRGATHQSAFSADMELNLRL